MDQGEKMVAFLLVTRVAWWRCLGGVKGREREKRVGRKGGVGVGGVFVVMGLVLGRAILKLWSVGSSPEWIAGLGWCTLQLTLAVQVLECSGWATRPTRTGGVRRVRSALLRCAR